MNKAELQNIGQISDNEVRYTVVVSAKKDANVSPIKTLLQGKKQ